MGVTKPFPFGVVIWLTSWNLSGSRKPNPPNRNLWWGRETIQTTRILLSSEGWKHRGQYLNVR